MCFVLSLMLVRVMGSSSCLLRGGGGAYVGVGEELMIVMFIAVDLWIG